MNFVLRYLTIRLWLLLIWGTPLGFWLLPRVTAWFSSLSPGIFLTGFFIVSGCVQGILLDLIGRWRIAGLIREGELWEQAGIRSRAERRYLSALRVFDSVFVSPWSAKSLSLALTRAMAGFYLSGPVDSASFRRASGRYLLNRPEDRELAKLWLDRAMTAAGSDGPDPLIQSVFTELAKVHFDHPEIAARLALSFVDRGRSDFTAKRLYRAVLRWLESAGHGRLAHGYEQRMEELLGPDELPREDTGQEELPGEPQESRSFPTLGDRVASVDVLIPEYRGKREKLSLKQGLAKVLKGFKRAGAGVFSFIFHLLSSLSEMTAGIGEGVSRHRAGLKKIARYGLLTGICLCLGFFLWNSLSHLLTSKSPKVTTQKIIQAPPEDPFTIQVAAYLKAVHADRYVEKLKSLGVSAHVKKTEGGGKIWYLVRISHFKSKDEAADFGRQLKEQGKIKDFFVSNR